MNYPHEIRISRDEFEFIFNSQPEDVADGQVFNFPVYIDGHTDYVACHIVGWTDGESVVRLVSDDPFFYADE